MKKKESMGSKTECREKGETRNGNGRLHGKKGKTKEIEQSGEKVKNKNKREKKKRKKTEKRGVKERGDQDRRKPKASSNWCIF